MQPRNKVIVFGDLHFGIRGDSIVFQSYQKTIISELILPYLNSNKDQIKSLIFLGDIFDRRKSINISTLQLAKWFFSQLKEFEIDMIVGNHDVFYRNTNDINSPKLIFEEYNNITVYDSLPVQKGTFLFVPWISPDNMERTLDTIKTSDAKYLFGHLEISNAILIGTQRCDFGLSPHIFKNYGIVFSGHFHARQTFNNILYTGCIWELTRDDSYQDKGFFKLTLNEKGELDNIEFIPITDKFKIFNTVVYDENILQKQPENTKTPILDLILPMSLKPVLENRYVKVIYSSNKNQLLWSKFLERLNSFNPAEISFQESISESEDNNEDFVIKAENNDILDVVKSYLNDIATSETMKEDVFQVFVELYKEAFQMES